jgi:hypothetical protein
MTFPYLKPLVYYILNKLFRFNLRPIDYSIGWGMRDEQSHLFLWGDTTKKLFNKRKNVQIIGNPGADRFYNESYENIKDKEIIGKLNLRNTKSILISAICISDVDSIVCQSTLTWYYEIVKNMKEYNVIIKIHPRDDKNDFSSLDLLSNLFIVKNEFVFSDLLRVSDLNISHYSATSFDSILYGIPVILLPLSAVTESNKLYWFDSDVFFKVKDIDSCIVSVRNLMISGCQDSKIRETFINDMFSLNFGLSGKKTAKEIVKIINFKRSL